MGAPRPTPFGHRTEKFLERFGAIVAGKLVSRHRVRLSAPESPQAIPQVLYPSAPRASTFLAGDGCTNGQGTGLGRALGLPALPRLRIVPEAMEALGRDVSAETAAETLRKTEEVLEWLKSLLP